METYRDLIAAVARRQPQMLKMIAQLVGLESPTEDRAAVNRCVTLVEGWIKASWAVRAGAASKSRLEIC